MKLLWTRESLLNLKQIQNYIASDNPNAAVQIVDKIISLAESIEDNPERGRIVPELSTDKIREILYKNYRVVYLLKKGSVEILTVFEGHKILKSEDLEKIV
jgi:toxin ParE1/3/4